MKKITLITLSVLLVSLLVFNALPVTAAKPPRVITVSNGFPSGMHFNLNIHGKNPETFTTPGDPPYPSPYGNSIFIPEYTADYAPITIECISNKKGGTKFEVIDPYAMPSLDSDGVTPTGFAYADDLAQFNLPYKIQTDEGVINANGYYVYGRIHGRPNNGKIDGVPSSIIVTPNPILQVESDGITFPLGLITQQGTYVLDEETFIRFDDTSVLPKGNGKGRSIAKNITDMFMWTGWVFDSSLDTSGDGVVDEDDVPISYDLIVNGGNENGVIDPAELANWLDDMVATGQARYYEDWWVFDIAEIVTQSWGIQNDGTKLLQIRFYPVATTEFTERAHIVVEKETDPLTDTTTLFDFDADYRNSWQMTSDQFCLSLGLDASDAASPYTVTELAKEGWDLTGVNIDDPTSDSYYFGNTAYIVLADGETVRVTFENTQRGKITVVKETVNDDGSFDFDPSWSEIDFSLSNGTSETSDWLVPGIYTVEELAAAAGWDLTSITITGDDDYTVGNIGTRTATVELDPGEDVTVTFTNTYTAP